VPYFRKDKDTLKGENLEKESGFVYLPSGEWDDDESEGPEEPLPALEMLLVPECSWALGET